MVTKVIFTNLPARLKVYKKRVQLKQTNVWFNEDLVKSNMELHYKARCMYKEGLLGKYWTYLGDVFVKMDWSDQPIQINNLSELTRATDNSI